MKIIQGEKVHIKSWCDNPESGAIDQAINLAKLPFVFKHVALMSDTHQGYGMPIGGVIACENIIIPNAVGVDIGCGMCAVKTSILAKDLNTETLKKIMGEIRKVIPMGNGKGGSHEEPQDKDLMPTCLERPVVNQESIILQQFDRARHQLGTLGGGNHFIEIQTDGEYVWIMIHSGSRNLGHIVATHYNYLAKDINEKYHSSVNKSMDLAFFPFHSKEGQAYYKEMQYCMDFALNNRLLMMKRVIKVFQDEFKLDGGEIVGNYQFKAPKDNGIINIAHNYASLENHFGRNLVIHRKGATRAYEGEIGIIPGSQGTSSYIVKGKGNVDSFKSCSHGAGRNMSRSKARATLNLEDEIKKMDDKGIIHGIRTQKELDESSSAYKDINVVMKEQKDLVDIVVKLEPLGSIKG